MNHIKKKHEGESAAEVTVAETDTENSNEPALDEPDNEDQPEVASVDNVNAITGDHGVINDTKADDVNTTSRGDDLDTSNKADVTI